MSNGRKIISAVFLLAFLAAHQPPAEAGKKGPLSHPGFAHSRTSIEFVDVGSGREIFAHNADIPLVPASCAKIVTAAAVFETLGPSHRFETRFYSDETPRAGVINTFFIRGTGDPVLVNEDIEKIAEGLRQKGVRKILSGIVIDNSFIDSGDYPRKDTGEGRAYTAKTSAVAVNFNSAEIEISPSTGSGHGPGRKKGLPGLVTVNPPSDYFQIKNKLITGKRFRVSINLVNSGGGETIIVSGTIPARFETQKFYRSVNNSTQYAGSVIRWFLEKKGIKVDGQVRDGQVPAAARELLRFESRPLSEIVMEMMKRSNNFIAEQILKHMGAVKFGGPGSTAKGLKAAQDYMASIGIPKNEWTLENGSGLSDNSKISAGNLVKILTAARKNRKYGKDFFDSLSVLGVDGTTKKWRFVGDLRGKAFVKTGSINGVSSLAGYLPTRDGSLAAFAIIVNGPPRWVAKAHEAEINLLREVSK